eukprot:2966827-Rhodomonas_salina.1
MGAGIGAKGKERRQNAVCWRQYINRVLHRCIAMGIDVNEVPPRPCPCLSAPLTLPSWLITKNRQGTKAVDAAGGSMPAIPHG